MQEPEKPDAKKLEDGLKGIDLDKFGDATRKMMKGLNENKADEAARKTLKKGVAFFKKAKAALKGDESAKEHMADAATKVWGVLDKAQKSAQDIVDRADKKIAEARDKKNPPPKP